MSTTPPTPLRGTRIGLLAVGSALVAALLVLASMQFAGAEAGHDQSGRSVIAPSFSSVHLDVSDADVKVRYEDVERATLDFDSRSSTLAIEHEVRGGVLSVRVHQREWWGFRLFPRPGDARLEVVLPVSSAPMALDLQSSAGIADVAGDFSTTSIASSAGDIRLTGETGPLRLATSAGNITATALDASGPVVTDSSAGDTRLSFVSLPPSIAAQGSAGNVKVELPDGVYEIRASASFGDVHQGLRSTPGADRRYTFQTSAGDLDLRND